MTSGGTREQVLATTTEVDDEGIIINALSFSSLNPEFKNDKEVTLHIVRMSGRQLEFASDDMRSDIDVVMAAVSSETQYNGSSLQYAPDQMKDNKEVVLAAIAGTDGQALSYASKRLRGNAEVVRAAMLSHPYAIQTVDFADGQMSREEQEEVVMIYLESCDQDVFSSLPDFIDDGKFPKWAVEDKDIVTKCCTKNAMCMRYLSDELKADKEFILSLFVASPAGAKKILGFSKLYENPELVAAAAACTPTVITLEQAADDLGGRSALIVLCEKASAEEKTAIATALKAPADAVFAAAADAGGEPEMVFAIGASAGKILEQLREMTKIEDSKGVSMVLLDIPDNGAYYLWQRPDGAGEIVGTVTETDVSKFVADYRAKSLERRQLEM
jgi:hypothetical protein